MNKNTIFNLIFLLIVKQSLCNYYCKNDISIKNQISSVEKNYIGQGSFGKIYGNESHVSKTMKTDDSVSLYLLNNELKVMIAYNTEYDFTQLHLDNCWYKYNSRQYHYEVKIKMDRMASDLKAALKRSSLKSRSIWKIDMIFKILVSIKKLHDYNILHLDLKEGNIMMMNDYTPVLADFGMALLNGEKRKWRGGTPLFMSPEVNSTQYSKGADIFALGIVFFQILNERFVKNQSFRKRCNVSEAVYSNIYCLFDETIEAMTNKSVSKRPSVNRAILDVLSVMKKYIESNPDNFEGYMQDELNSFNSSRANPATKLNLEKLIEKQDERRTIYQQAANGASERELRELVNNYARPSKDIEKFFRENSNSTSLVGKNKQEIKDQNEIVDDEEDQLQSIKNIEQRMNDAGAQRLEFLKNEKFFKEEDIVDRVVDVPQVRLPKKSPSNNVEALRLQQNKANLKAPVFLNGQNRIKNVPLLKPAPSNNIQPKKFVPSNNIQPKKIVPSNNFQVAKKPPIQNNQFKNRGISNNVQFGKRVPQSNNILVQKNKVKPSNNFNAQKKKVVPSNNVVNKSKPMPMFIDQNIDREYQDFKQKFEASKQPVVKDSNYFAQQIAKNLKDQQIDNGHLSSSQIMRKIDEGLLNGNLKPGKQDLNKLKYF